MSQIEPDVYVVLHYKGEKPRMELYAANVVENNLVEVAQEIASYPDSTLPLWLVAMTQHLPNKGKRSQR